MLVFCTEEAELAKRNANAFFARDREIIDAAVHLINEHNPNPACLFNEKLARKALR
jgi:hypothetical protein